MNAVSPKWVKPKSSELHFVSCKSVFLVRRINTYRPVTERSLNPIPRNFIVFFGFFFFCIPRPVKERSLTQNSRNFISLVGKLCFCIPKPVTERSLTQIPFFFLVHTPRPWDYPPTIALASFFDGDLPKRTGSRGNKWCTSAFGGRRCLLPDKF